MVLWRVVLLGLALVAGGCSGGDKAAESTSAAADGAVAEAAPDGAGSETALAPPAAPAAQDLPAAAGPVSGPAAEFVALKPAGPVAASSGRAPAQPGDTRDSFDHPAVGRYAGSRITSYRQKQYDALRLIHGLVVEERQTDPTNAVTVEGRVTELVYEAPRDRSPLEIFRSYQKALAEAGFETAFQCPPPEKCRPTVNAIVNRPGGFGYFIPDENIHALAAFRRSDGIRLNLAVSQYGNSLPRISLLVVEPATMDEGVTTLSATDIGRDVAASGRAVLYALEFDTDKAVLKPESEPQLKAIADWLNQTKARALVVGHTDNQGAFAYNVGLSQRRAEAVVAALTTRFGVDRKQLTAFGNGMAAPVASNRTPDGQARNRRVEVVEQI